MTYNIIKEKNEVTISIQESTEILQSFCVKVENRYHAAHSG